jgi:hypothetical protein
MFYLALAGLVVILVTLMFWVARRHDRSLRGTAERPRQFERYHVALQLLQTQLDAARTIREPARKRAALYEIWGLRTSRLPWAISDDTDINDRLRTFDHRLMEEIVQTGAINTSVSIDTGTLAPDEFAQLMNRTMERVGLTMEESSRAFDRLSEDFDRLSSSGSVWRTRTTTVRRNGRPVADGDVEGPAPRRRTQAAAPQPARPEPAPRPRSWYERLRDKEVEECPTTSETKKTS